MHVYLSHNRKVRSPFSATIFSSSNFVYSTFLPRLLLFLLSFFYSMTFLVQRFSAARFLYDFLATTFWHDFFFLF